MVKNTIVFTLRDTGLSMDPSHIQPVLITCGVITVSSSRDTTTDTSGKIISESLEQAGYPVNYYTIVPDKREEIRSNN